MVDDVAKWFGISKGQLAETVGVRPSTFQRVKRVTAPKTQTRVKEMLEIIGRVTDWAEASTKPWRGIEPSRSPASGVEQRNPW